jgi:hypothetical protein
MLKKKIAVLINTMAGARIVFKIKPAINLWRSSFYYSTDELQME